MQIYNSQLKIWIALYTDKQPAQPPIPQPTKRPYLQIVLPHRLKDNDNFKANFSEIKSYGYSSIMNGRLIITISGSRKIAAVINLMSRQPSYRQKQNEAALIQLREFAQAEISQVAHKAPAPKSKRLEHYEAVIDSNAGQRANATAIHQTSRLKRKGSNKEEVFKHTVDRCIIEIEAFNGICYRLLLNQQTPKVRAVHTSSGQRVGVIS